MKSPEMVKVNRVLPLATMNVWTKFNRRLNHLILSRHFTQNSNLTAALGDQCWDHHSLPLGTIKVNALAAQVEVCDTPMQRLSTCFYMNQSVQTGRHVAINTTRTVTCSKVQQTQCSVLVPHSLLVGIDCHLSAPLVKKQRPPIDFKAGWKNEAAMKAHSRLRAPLLFEHIFHLRSANLPLPLH